jgi:hypothetical protein
MMEELVGSQSETAGALLLRFGDFFSCFGCSRFLGRSLFTFVWPRYKFPFGGSIGPLR